MYNIEVEHLTKDYGHNRGVFDISFRIKEGEVFGFLGPNGAGKSTAIRHLMGFSKPQSGHTKIFQMDTFDNYHQILSKVGYLPGEISLPSGLNSKGFIQMMKGLYKSKIDRTAELIQYFDFKLNDIPLNKLSLGDKRKLTIITAFMHDPKVLILDEPTSGLDIKTQQKFIEFIKDEKTKGKTILLSSHIFSEVEATCDRIAIIKEGKIVAEIDSKDLNFAKNKTYLLTFENSEQAKNFKLKFKNKFKIINTLGKTLILEIPDSKINLLIKSISNYQIKDFSHAKETLEKYFMKYYNVDTKFKGL